MRAARLIRSLNVNLHSLLINPTAPIYHISGYKPLWITPELIFCLQLVNLCTPSTRGMIQNELICHRPVLYHCVAEICGKSWLQHYSYSRAAIGGLDLFPACIGWKAKWISFEPSLKIFVALLSSQNSLNSHNSLHFNHSFYSLIPLMFLYMSWSLEMREQVLPKNKKTVQNGTMKQCTDLINDAVSQNSCYCERHYQVRHVTSGNTHEVLGP